MEILFYIGVLLGAAALNALLNPGKRRRSRRDDDIPYYSLHLGSGDSMDRSGNI